ncbi:hypothetical protein Q8G28_13625 [Lysinibacillus capsici]|uniref:hypothetical protein n=1 Tax=Lysinibacillus capsici TaxID=2115968 RepID=UPI00273001BA|nr:hypothetical protein [Lysinibacillus capsici]MDP1394426.1 hypothetical protein [Lysinibacillus capsici]MDP1414903.1 hypothetical protein [Lysinibacillus capsici]MDP1430798.1 hypothetical protein [Lysinibacillus capsici]
MSIISANQIKEEQTRILDLSATNDTIHFTLRINPDCDISQLGFPKDTQFNSVLILINTFEKSYVKGNIQSVKIDDSKLQFITIKEDIFISFKTDKQKLNKFYLQTGEFQCKATKKGLYFTDDAHIITSIYVYYDLNTVETLLIIDPLNAQNFLTISKSNNGAFGSLIKSLLLSHSILTMKQFESITVGALNEE